MADSNVIEKGNKEFLSYVAKFIDLEMELLRFGVTGVRNAFTDSRTKSRLDIHGNLNNYEVYSVSGIDSKHMDALMKHYGVEGRPSVDKETGFMVIIIDKDFNETLLKMEKDVLDRTVDWKSIMEMQNPEVVPWEVEHLEEAVEHTAHECREMEVVDLNNDYKIGLNKSGELEKEESLDSEYDSDYELIKDKSDLNHTEEIRNEPKGSFSKSNDLINNSDHTEELTNDPVIFESWEQGVIDTNVSTEVTQLANTPKSDFEKNGHLEPEYNGDIKHLNRKSDEHQDYDYEIKDSPSNDKDNLSDINFEEKQFVNDALACGETTGAIPNYTNELAGEPTEPCKVENTNVGSPIYLDRGIESKTEKNQQSLNIDENLLDSSQSGFDIPKSPSNNYECIPQDSSFEAIGFQMNHSFRNEELAIGGDQTDSKFQDNKKEDPLGRKRTGFLSYEDTGKYSEVIQDKEIKPSDDVQDGFHPTTLNGLNWNHAPVPIIPNVNQSWENTATHEDTLHLHNTSFIQETSNNSIPISYGSGASNGYAETLGFSNKNEYQNKNQIHETDKQCSFGKIRAEAPIENISRKPELHKQENNSNSSHGGEEVREIRDKEERTKAIQKEYDKKKERENINVYQIATGAALFTAYSENIDDSEQIKSHTSFHDAKEINEKEFTESYEGLKERYGESEKTGASYQYILENFGEEKTRDENNARFSLESQKEVAATERAVSGKADSIYESSGSKSFRETVKREMQRNIGKTEASQVNKVKIDEPEIINNSKRTSERNLVISKNLQNTAIDKLLQPHEWNNNSFHNIIDKKSNPAAAMDNRLEKPEDSSKHNMIKDTFSINRMELKNRYRAGISNKMIMATGELILAPASEGYRETEMGRGRREYAGISALTANRSFKASMKHYEHASYVHMNKILQNPSGEYKSLNEFMIIRGYGKLDFTCTKSARQTMENIYHTLQKAGLATNRNGSWDLMKFDKMYKSCKHKDDYSSLIRALKFSDLNISESKTIIKALGDVVVKTKNQREALQHKKLSGHSLRSMIAHIVRESEVSRGIMEAKQTYQSIRSTWKAARLGLIYTSKLAGRAAVFVANRKIFEDTLYSYGIHKAEAILQSQSHKKAERKEAKFQKKNNRKMERLVAKKILKADRRAKSSARLRTFTPAFLRENRLGGKIVNKVSVKLKQAGSSAIKISKAMNILAPIGMGKALLAKVKRKIMIIVGLACLIVLLVSNILMMGSMVVTTITGFFSGDNGEMMEDIYDSSMGQVLRKLMDAENKWIKSLKQDTTSIDNIFNYGIRYGENYETPEQYSSRIGLEYHSELIPYFTGNPFNFDLDEEVKSKICKQIRRIDGGVELKIEGKNGSPRTNNLKEILSMASVYFGHDSEAAEEHLDQADGTESGSTKQSGLTYTASNEMISKEDMTLSSGVFWNYCQNLFNISHQEVIDLSFVILPTKLTLDSAATPEDGTMNEVNTDNVTFCPEGDNGGCMEYDNFFYDHNGTLVMIDKEGNFHNVSYQVTPTDKRGISYEDQNEDKCWTDNMEGFREMVLRPADYFTGQSLTDCWEITFDEHPGVWDYYTIGEIGELLYDDGPKDDFSQKIIDISNHRGLSGYKSDSFDGLTRNTDGSFQMKADKFVIGDPYYKDGEQYTGAMRYRVSIIFRHKCDGNHHGRFCGGHLKADIKGIVLGFSDDQAAEGEYEGKIESGLYSHKDVSRFTVFDKLAVQNANDIFDADNVVAHSSEMESWEGWTKDNMELAVIKYNMDWEDIYGIKIGNAIGGTALTETEKESIMAAIMAEYPVLSGERIDVIKDGLNWVGNIGYSQAHHLCPLEGPCVRNNSSACGLSDCSGFLSNLWKNRLSRIHTTASFYTTYNPGKFSFGSAQPGDILLHYEGAIADGRGDHALLYLGNFEYNGIYQGWSIDCSTVDGLGNVFFRHRNYYDSCYVVSPAS